MSGFKTDTYVVVHPKLNMMVDKKLQRLAVGTELVLTDKQAASLGGKVRSLKAQKKLDMTPEPDKGKGK